MKKFLFGAATAAHQVEGNNTHSDCWVLENLKNSPYAEKSGMAVDHYNRYAEDIALLKKAGLNAYRFSIEWARIEPQEGVFDEKEVAHYNDVLDCCLNNGIVPVVTLMHFSSPAWLISKGGWGKEYVVGAFEKYVRYVVEKLGAKLQYVCTINEANMGMQLKKIGEAMMNASRRAKEGDVQVGVNFDMEKIIAGMKEQAVAFQCDPREINTFLKPRTQQQEEIVMRAHKVAVNAIKELAPNCKVGLTVSLYDYQPQAGGEAMAAKLWFEDFGFYLPYIENDDFVGVQNYSRKLIGAEGVIDAPTDAVFTQMGYEEYPLSVGNVVKKVAKEFHGEIVVTENGLATADDNRRCRFVEKAVQSVLDAKASGANVIGYFYWSLLDNFEWQAGFCKTFGLVAVDRNTQKRTPKNSLTVLGNIAKNHKE